MKAKILEKLKGLRLAQFKDVTDKTLESFAETLSVGLTEESNLDDVVKQWTPALVSMQGQINHDRSQYSKEPTPPTPVPTPTPPVPPKQDDIAAIIAEAMEKVTAPMKAMQDKLDLMEQAKTSKSLFDTAKASIRDKWGTFEGMDAKISEKVLNTIISQNPNPENAESITTAFEKEFNDMRSIYGLGNIQPVDTSKGGGDKAHAQGSAFKAQLMKEGKIPTED